MIINLREINCSRNELNRSKINTCNNANFRLKRRLAHCVGPIGLFIPLGLLWLQSTRFVQGPTLSRDPVFGHVTHFALTKMLNISKTVRDRNKISKAGIRKSMVADQMHMFVLPPLRHVTLFSVTWHILH